MARQAHFDSSAVPLLGQTESLQDLCGHWRVGERGRVLQLHHLPRFGVLWSASVRNCSEELFGAVGRADDCLHIRAHFGNTGIFNGEVSSRSNSIRWCSGSVWYKVEDPSQSPVRLRLGFSSIRMFFRAFCSEAKCGPDVAKYLRVIARLALSLSVFFVLVALVLALTVAFARMFCRAIGADTPWNESVGVWLASMFLEGVVVTYIVHEMIVRARNRPRALRNASGVIVVLLCSDIFLAIGAGPNIHSQVVDFGNETIDLGNQSRHQPDNSREGSFGANFPEHSAERIFGLQVLCGVLFAAALVCVGSRHAWRWVQDARVSREDPLSWPRVACADERQEVIRQFCQDFLQWRGSPLDLTVDEVYAISDEHWATRFHLQDEMLRLTAMPAIGCRAKMEFYGVRRLYHGAPSSSVRSICTTGFQVPEKSCMRPLMYGSGLYFTDLPQKAWQFTGDAKYLLVCDVALGRPKRMKDAEPTFSSELLRVPSIEGSLYDSVLGEDATRGGVLNHREFVVYGKEQVLPRYLLAITERPVLAIAERPVVARDAGILRVAGSNGPLMCFRCSIAEGNNGLYTRRVTAKEDWVCFVCRTDGYQGLWARP